MAEFIVVAALLVITVLFAGLYAALERVFPFLKGGSGRMG